MEINFFGDTPFVVSLRFPSNNVIIETLDSKEEKLRIDEMRKTIIGKWCDENSISQYFPDGTYKTIWDDGSEGSGTWAIDGNLLIKKRDSGKTYKAIILQFASTEFTTRGSDGSVWHNIRIE